MVLPCDPDAANKLLSHGGSRHYLTLIGQPFSEKIFEIVDEWATTMHGWAPEHGYTTCTRGYQKVRALMP